MTRFLLIRHAATDAVGKHLSGRKAGVSLNEEGRAQAHELAQRLAGISLAAIYSSPLERALETARQISQETGTKIINSDEFLELDFGEWTGLSFQELDLIQGFKNFNSFRSSTRIPGGELMMEGQLRVIRGMERLCLEHPDQTIAVISHADMIKAAIAYYAGIHLDMFHRIEISPASVSIVELYTDMARIVLMNDTGNL